MSFGSVPLQAVGVHMDSPSAERNKGPIWQVLSREVLPSLLQEEENQNQPQQLQVLEIAAGVGVHTLFFTEHMVQSLKDGVDVQWHATDPDPQSLASIQSRTQSHVDARVRSSIAMPPKQLTLNQHGIMEEEQRRFFTEQNKVDLIVCINMIHISPWDATLGLMKEASKLLKSETGRLFCYGPYLENGTGAASNMQFDASLKSRNPAWGVRNVEDVVQAAKEKSLTLVKKMDMPKENTSLIFQKQS